MSDNRNGERPSEVDREGSVVSGRARQQLTNLQKLGIAGLALIVSVAVIWIQQLSRPKQQGKPPEVALGGAGGFRQAPLVTPPPAAPLPMPAPRPVETPRLAVGPQRHEMTPAESPIFAFSGGGAEEEVRAAAPAAASGSAPAAKTATTSSIAARLRPTVLSGARATLLPHPDMLITEGTVIPCTLQTTINTELPGYVKCVLPQDIRGTTGNVVLLDRGTTVIGEVQNGLMQGQDRVFVLWDRAETPDHAIIELDSPGTDPLGAPGVPGGVNNHLLERFGAAIVLSVIQGALQAGTALAGNSGTSSNGLSITSFSSNGQDISNTALQNSINIPPTLEVNQGDNVSIFVAKDLDFSDIYKLRVTSAAYAP